LHSVTDLDIFKKKNVGHFLLKTKHLALSGPTNIPPLHYTLYLTLY